MQDSEKKISKTFRLSPSVLLELESVADAAGKDRTEIVETAIMNVRAVIERELQTRLSSISKLPKLKKQGSLIQSIATGAAGKLAKGMAA